MSEIQNIELVITELSDKKAESKRKSMQKYREKNRDKLNELTREWRQRLKTENPERYDEYKQLKHNYYMTVTRPKLIALGKLRSNEE